MKKLNIGMVGYGFMGRTHSNAFRKVSNFFDLPYEPVLKTICARNADRANAFAAKWGYQSAITDWRELVESPEIDVIDIASPTHTRRSQLPPPRQARWCCARSRWAATPRKPRRWWPRWSRRG
jgi:predicted dehydrogenase